MTPLTSIDEMELDFRRAEEARRSGNFAVALDGYLEIISRRMAGIRSDGQSQLSAADIVVLERAADLAVLFGADKGADYLLEGMSSALESAGNFFGADYTTVKRIHLALSTGRLEDCQRLLSGMRSRIGDVCSIPLTESGFSAWESSCRWKGATSEDRIVIFSRLYLIFGWLLASLGQYNDALAALERGLRFTTQDAPDLARRALIPLQLTIAVVYLESGELAAASDHLDELKPLLDVRRQPGSYVRCLELESKLMMLSGDFGGALLRYLEVRRCCAENGFDRAELVAMLNLSDALIFLNNINVGQQIVKSVIAQAQLLDDAYVLVRAERQLAVAAERSSALEGGSAVAPHRPVRPKSRINPAPNISSDFVCDTQQSENFLARFEDRTLEFHWQLGQGNLTMAATIVRDLLRSFNTTDSTLIRIRLLVLEGTLAYYTGDVAHAEACLTDSLPVLRQLGLTSDLWQAQRILGWCRVRLGFPESRYRELTEDNKRLLTSMTASLPAAYQPVFLLNKWTTEEEFIAGEIRQLERLKEKANASRWFRRRQLRWSWMNRLYRLLSYVEQYRRSLVKEADPEKEKDKTETSSLLKFLWNHPRDRVTIAFMVLPDRVLVVKAGWMSLDFDVARISRIDIRDAVKRWHVLVNRSSAHAGGRPLVVQEDLLGEKYLDSLFTADRNLEPVEMVEDDADSADSPDSVAATLAHRLLIPGILERLPSRVRAITIIPHDGLHGFPFAAIKHADQYLCEQFNLVTDVSVFGKEPTRSVDGQKALFVGVSTGAERYAALPGVAEEIDKLEQWCNEHALPFKTLKNERAIKSSVVQNLNYSTIVHIACHGVFRPDQPDASGLVLVPEPDKVDILSLRDLSELDLRHVQHVSLSSCSSADNFILPGRWVIGLPETLRRTGAGSVLACLWPINDRFAQSFAARFYEYLNTCARDEALRRTQMDCLGIRHSNGIDRPLENVERIDTTNPLYWASYVLCGDHRRLKFRFDAP